MSGDAGKRQNTPAPDVAAREAQVVEYRRAKIPWAEIAAATGYANPSAAQRAYRRALGRVLKANVDEHRREEIDMLDAMHSAFWRSVTDGDVAAGRLILDISVRRARLLGLDAALHVKAEVTDATRERVLELVDKVRALPPADGEDHLTTRRPRTAG